MFPSDPVSHKAAGSHLLSTLWGAPHAAVQCCPGPAQSGGGAGLSPRQFAFLDGKQVHFLGGARCRYSQRLRALISSRGFVNPGLVLYLCTALLGKTVAQLLRACAWVFALRAQPLWRHMRELGPVGHLYALQGLAGKLRPPGTNCSRGFIFPAPAEGVCVPRLRLERGFGQRSRS